MDKALLQKYADFVVKVGVNVQPRQTFLIRCPVDMAFFAHAGAKAGYEAGAKEVIVRYEDEQLARLNMLKAVRDTMSRPVATILDTKGPEIRIRSFSTKTIELTAGDRFTLHTDEVVGDHTQVSVTYPKLHEELEIGQQILIDDGLVAIRVEEIGGCEIRCTV